VLEGFYAVPAVRFCLHGVIDTVGIVVHLYLVLSFKNPDELESMDPRLPLLSDCDPLEITWIVFHTGNAIDNLYHAARFRSLQVKETDEFRWISYASGLFFFVSIVSRLMQESAGNPGLDLSSGADPATADEWATWLYNVYRTSMSLNSIFVVVSALRFLAVYKPIGVLIVMINQMVADLITFMALLAAVTVGFAFALAGLQLQGHAVSDGHDPFPLFGGDSPSGLVLPLWATYGDFSPDMYDRLTGPIIWCYILLSSVILVNLLVAMFSSTFARVESESEQEYAFARCCLMFKYKVVVLSVPKVLNAPYIIFCALRRIFRWARKLVEARRGSRVTMRYTSCSWNRSVGVAAGPDSSRSTSPMRSLRSQRRKPSLKRMQQAAETKDGKLLVEKYLESQAVSAADTVHAVATSSRELVRSLAQRHEQDMDRVMTKLVNQQKDMDRMMSKLTDLDVLMRTPLFAPPGSQCSGTSSRAGSEAEPRASDLLSRASDLLATQLNARIARVRTESVSLQQDADAVRRRVREPPRRTSPPRRASAFLSDAFCG